MRNKKEYWEVKPRKILVIIFEITREFFINDTTQESNWKYYDGHYRGQYRLTKDRFEACKKDNYYPPIFFLGTVIGTKNDVFQDKLAWSRYFFDHGFSPVVGPKMQRIIDEFEPRKSELYLEIKNIPIEKILHNENNLLPSFRRIGKQKRTENSALKPYMKQVTLRLNQHEYDLYAGRAKLHGLSLNQYIRECVRLGGVISTDTSAIEDYYRTVGKCYRNIEGLFQTILFSNNYVPADMANLQDWCKEIGKSNASVCHEIIRLYRQLRRMKTGEQINKDPLKHK